jgi:hypothetical protein
MATTQIDASANLGKFLQRVYSDGITNQISEDFRDWEMVSKHKVSDQAARTVDFLVNKSYGAAAVQWKNSGSVTLPAGSQSSTAEGSAGFNSLYSTIELEYDLWERAKSGAKKYLEPLAHEIQNKGIVQKRLLSASFHLDGTGVLGEMANADSVNYTTEQDGAAYGLTMTLKNTDTAKGGVRYFEYGDRVKLAEADGTASASFSLATLIVEDIDRENNTISVAAITTSTGVALDISGYTTAADEMFYRLDSTVLDTGASTLTDGTDEWNAVSETMCGLETLTENDGRKIHGLTLSGVYKGEHYDASAAAIDISHIQKAMDRIKTRNGPSFKYRQVLVAPETLSAFIESQEADRRLVANSDKERGFSGFCFVHGNDKLELASSEFCGDKRMWAIPEGAGGVLELHGKDFKEISVGGGSEYLKPSSTAGRYESTVQKFMMGYMTLICKRPGAILKIHNFEN